MIHLLTISRAKAFHRCERAHYHSYECGVVPVRDPDALRVGTRVHAGLEAWWKWWQQPDEQSAPLDAALASLDDHIRASNDPYHEPDPYEHARLVAMLAGYDVAWTEFARTVTVIGVEVPFRIPLLRPGDLRPARTWMLAGKMDGLLQMGDGRIAVLEHKCLAGDARIFDHATATYERVDALFERQTAPMVTAMDGDGQLRVVQADRLTLASVRPIFRIATANGRSLRVSGNHPILTQRGWVSADALTTDDWVATPLEMPCSRPDAPFSDEEIRLIGYMIGDGSLSNMSFTKRDTAVMADVVRCGAALGETVTPKSSKGRAPYVKFSGRVSAPVRKLMERAGLSHSTLSAGKRMPMHLGLSDRQLAQLVGSLWSTDGCVDTFRGKKLRIIYTSVSHGLCVDIQHALQRLGLASSVCTTSVLYKGERRAVSTVQVVSRESKLRFLRLAVDGTIPVLRSRVPLDVAIQTIPDALQAADWTRQPRVVASVNERIRWDRVKDVEEQNQEQTYDISVPGLHTFVVDGIVTHNTAGDDDVGPGSSYRRRLTVDGQVSQYFDGAEALGFPADLCLYDVLVKPGQKPLEATKNPRIKKDGTPYANQRMTDETPEEYLSRVTEAIAANPGAYYQHAEVVRLEGEREVHRLNVWHTVRAIEGCRKAGYWTQNSDACFKYGSPCSYWDVCSGVADINDPMRYKVQRDVNPELLGEFNKGNKGDQGR